MSKLTSIDKRVETIRTNRIDHVVKRITGHALQRIRKRILIRDDYTCQSCGTVSTMLQIDHITPLYLGGLDKDFNRQSLCLKCHDLKSKKEEQDRYGR